MSGSAYSGVNISRAPWTAEQIAILARRQQDNTVHPYTCNSHGCKRSLLPTSAGLVCPACGYAQNWCLASELASNPNAKPSETVAATGAIDLTMWSGPHMTSPPMNVKAEQPPPAVATSRPHWKTAPDAVGVWWRAKDLSAWFIGEPVLIAWVQGIGEPGFFNGLIRCVPGIAFWYGPLVITKPDGKLTKPGSQPPVAMADLPWANAAK